MFVLFHRRSLHWQVFLSKSLYSKSYTSVVVDGPFQTENGVQTGVQAMTSCVAINLRVTMIYEPQKKSKIFSFF